MSWIKLHRKITDHDIWKAEKFTPFQAWIYLLFEAKYKKSIAIFNGQNITLERGQIVTSIRKLASVFSWSTSRTLAFLAYLKAENMLLHQKDTKKTLLTVVNYDSYQISQNTKQSMTDTQNNTQNNTQNKVDNLIIRKNIRNIYSDFENFWKQYHEITGLKKTDKDAAKKYFDKLKKEEKEKSIQMIKPYFESLPIYNGHKPIKKARTYLRDKNFNDEFEIKSNFVFEGSYNELPRS